MQTPALGGFGQGDYLYNPRVQDLKSVVFDPEEMNEFGVPYGFEAHELVGMSSGYPVYFDARITARRAMDLFMYLRSGDLLSDDVSSMEVRAVVVIAIGSLPPY